MKPILISLSPNTEKDDVIMAAGLLLRPWRWKEGREQKKLEKRFEKLYPGFQAFGFGSGRTALWAVLKALGVKKGDEVLVPVPTCVVVPNAVLAAGAKPVFVDTEKNSVNLSLTDLKSKFTRRTRAVIVQHLFGYPDEVEKIKNWCQEKDIWLIEDCAQALGAMIRGKLVGSFGVAAIFSFGRDKIISSVNGGLAVIKKGPPAERLKKLYHSLPYPSLAAMARGLLHPLLFAVANPLYFSLKLGKFSLGKGLVYLFQQLRLVKRPVLPVELAGRLPASQRCRLAEAQAALAYHQFNKLKRNLSRRRKIASFYFNQLKQVPSVTLINQRRETKPAFLRFPILVDSPQMLIRFALERKVQLGNWYRPVIAPEGVELKKVGYRPGSCPHAENLSRRLVNLPTYPKMSMLEAERVVKALKEFF